MIKKTSDIYLCSAYLSLGANLSRVDRTDPRHMQFELNSPALTFTSGELAKMELDLDVIETDWANGKLMVNATAYADALKRMKSVVHSNN